MKNIILVSFIVISSFGIAQTYTEYTMPNSAVVSDVELTFEKGDSMIVLVDNSTNPPKVYVLENMTTPNYISPILETGWTTTILYKQHSTTYHFIVGQNFTVVNDNNGYSYLRIH